MIKLSQLYIFALALFVITGVNQVSFAETSGTFTVVKGEVQVISASGASAKAKVGGKVIPSDTINAGADSRAKIIMADQNIINISPETKLTLEKYIYDPTHDNKQVTLNVQYGKVRATVEQKYDGEVNKFHIKTPAAVAGVRGTDFLTSYTPATKETKIVTFEGKVAVGLPGPQGQILNPVMVPPGQMTTAIKGTPPTAPVPVPAEEFKNIRAESQADAPKKDAPTGDSGTTAKEENKKESKDEAPSKDSEKTEDSKKTDEKGKDQGQKNDEGKKTDETKPTDSKDKNGSDKNAKDPAPGKSAEQGPNDQPSNSQARTEPEGNKPAPNAKNEGPPATTSNREPASTANTPPASGPTAGPALTPTAPPPPDLPKGPAPGTMMLDRADLAPSVSRDVMTPNLQNAIPVVNNFAPYVPPNQTTQQIINQTSQIIQNNAATKSTVNIHIQHP